jgi:hypothetical protein
LSLFFNGSSAPQISASKTVDGAGFSAFGGTSAALNAPATVGGAGTLSFEDGGNVVSLTVFTLSSPAQDRVSPYNNVPSGILDYVGTITLDVTPTPEPSTIALIGLGLAAFGWSRKRSRA